MLLKKNKQGRKSDKVQAKAKMSTQECETGAVLQLAFSFSKNENKLLSMSRFPTGASCPRSRGIL